MDKESRKLKVRKLDALYITTNPLSCWIVYFCLCFSWVRIMYDLLGESPFMAQAYLIALAFTIATGLAMGRWAKRVVRQLHLVES